MKNNGKKCKKGQEKGCSSEEQIFEKQLKEWCDVENQLEPVIDELSIDNYRDVADKIKEIIKEYATKTSIMVAKATIINAVHSKLFSIFGMEGYHQFINDEDGKCFLDLIGEC